MKEGKKPKDRDLVPYMAVWEELAVIEELVCRGERIVITEGRCATNDMALRDWVVDLGHSAHQGVDATKRQLRVSVTINPVSENGDNWSFIPRNYSRPRTEFQQTQDG